MTPPRRVAAGAVFVFAAQGPLACRGGACAARGCSPARNIAGKAKPRPTGNGNAAASSDRSRQGMAARAACRPPLRPNETHTIKICSLRRFVGRGLDPAAGTIRQTRHSPQTNTPAPGIAGRGGVLCFSPSGGQGVNPGHGGACARPAALRTPPRPLPPARSARRRAFRRRSAG